MPTHASLSWSYPEIRRYSLPSLFRVHKEAAMSGTSSSVNSNDLMNKRVQGTFHLLDLLQQHCHSCSVLPWSAGHWNWVPTWDPVPWSYQLQSAKQTSEVHWGCFKHYRAISDLFLRLRAWKEQLHSWPFHHQAMQTLKVCQSSEQTWTLREQWPIMGNNSQPQTTQWATTHKPRQVDRQQLSSPDNTPITTEQLYHQHHYFENTISATKLRPRCMSWRHCPALFTTSVTVCVLSNTWRSVFPYFKLSLKRFKTSIWKGQSEAIDSHLHG